MLDRALSLGWSLTLPSASKIKLQSTPLEHNSLARVPPSFQYVGRVRPFHWACPYAPIKSFLPPFYLWRQSRDKFDQAFRCLKFLFPPCKRKAWRGYLPPSQKIGSETGYGLCCMSSSPKECISPWSYMLIYQHVINYTHVLVILPHLCGVWYFDLNAAEYL